MSHSEGGGGNLLTPDFIIHPPIKMKTTAPTINGNQLLSGLAGPNTNWAVDLAMFQANVKRNREASAKIIRPAQKTRVFSPSNIALPFERALRVYYREQSISILLSA